MAADEFDPHQHVPDHIDIITAEGIEQVHEHLSDELGEVGRTHDAGRHGDLSDRRVFERVAAHRVYDSLESDGIIAGRSPRIVGRYRCYRPLRSRDLAAGCARVSPLGSR